MGKRKLQVFVSGTFSDLKEERQAAVAAILKAGHIPAGMELFTAGDKSQLDTIKRWIDSSDVYMLILGGRYGSIESVSGLSYTEIEYDYAVAQGKPIFSVVITEEALEEKVRRNGTDFIELDRPHALKKFREKVLSKVSSFFDDEKDVRLCVHESLADFYEDSSILGWVSAAEIGDVSQLRQDMNRVVQENERLKLELSQSQEIISKLQRQRPSEDLDEVIDTLREIVVNVPSYVSKEDVAFDTSLLEVLTQAKETLINGVTNATNVDEIDSFYYHAVFPKLFVHGLSSNEKVSGALYRRSFLNSRGAAVIAEIERRVAKSKAENRIKPAKSDALIDAAAQLDVSKSVEASQSSKSPPKRRSRKQSAPPQS